MIDFAFLASTFRLGPSIPAAEQRRSWNMIVPCAILVAGAAIWFVVLQVAVLRSICPYCMTAHACGFVAAAIALGSLPKRLQAVKPWELESVVFITAATIRKLVLIALFGLAVLVAGQFLHQPASYVVQQIAAPASASTNSITPTNQAMAQSTTTSVTNPSAASTEGGVASPSPTLVPPVQGTPPATAPKTGRLFPIYNGRFQVDLADVPTLGAPTNAQVIVTLHDYTCHHCRLMHPLLVEAQRAFSDRLVAATLPMPFDPNCNPLMQRPNPKHTNACDYARLSLAVWRADRSKHHTYDDYLFTGDEPPPLRDARQAAIELVGAAALDSALRDPWVDQHVRLGISIYETAYRAGQGSMPQFIIGPSVAVGTLPKEKLMELLEKNLGLAVPSSPPPTAQ